MSGGRSTACARSSRRSRNCSSSGSGCVPMSGRPHRLPERCERAVEVHPHRRLRALQHRRDLRRRQLLLYLKDHGRALLRREPAHGLPEPLQRPLPSDRVHGVLGGCGLAVEEWLVRFRVGPLTAPHPPPPEPPPPRPPSAPPVPTPPSYPAGAGPPPPRPPRPRRPYFRYASRVWLTSRRRSRRSRRRSRVSWRRSFWSALRSLRSSLTSLRSAFTASLSPALRSW